MRYRIHCIISLLLPNSYLKLDWNYVHELYLNCYKFDTSRIESLYLIGRHYLLNKNIHVAWIYLKQAFESGIPTIQMSFHKNIYYYHLPKDLLYICYKKKDFELGEKCCRRIIENHTKDDTEINSWLNMFYLLNLNKKYRNKPKQKYTTDKLIVFISPGGWDKWDGETLYTKGLGGSENFSIKYTEKLSEMGYTCLVFCDCEKEKIFNKVSYMPLYNYIQFVSTYHIDACFVNRNPEWLQVCLENNIPKTYLILHDKVLAGVTIPESITGVLCISEWHKQHFITYYPSLETKTSVISYGIDVNSFPSNKKIPFMFIFPSFPNRGLFPLLNIFPKIIERYPNAMLHTFCDLDHPWLQKHYQQHMDLIKFQMKQLKT